MATNNAINSEMPINIQKGGTGTNTLTDHGVLVGSGTTAVTALTVGNATQLLVANSSADPAFATSAGPEFTWTSSTAGVNRTLLIDNSSLFPDFPTELHILSGGSSAGDAYLTFEVASATNFSMGVDNSTSDSFKISASSTLGTNDTFVLQTSGELNLPLTPAFCAYNSVLRSGVGSPYTLIFDTELFDIGGNYNATNGTFTAPISGNYIFSAVVSFDSTATSATLRIESSTDDILLTNNPNVSNDSNGNMSLSVHGSVRLDALDTCTITIINGTNILNGSIQTFFSGYLAN